MGLAVCLVVATFVSVYRLKEQQIFVSDSSRVNMAGLVTVACFDKTGTYLAPVVGGSSSLIGSCVCCVLCAVDHSP